MNEAIRKRLDNLSAQIIPGLCFCLVELPDGTQAEKTMDEWFENRQKWRWLRMTRGGNISAIKLLLAAIDDEVNADRGRADEET